MNLEAILAAADVLRNHMSPAPLIRSYEMEQHLGLDSSRRVWFKDYGWTPVGAYKLMGALNWMHHHLERIGERPVAAHSSGNFAAGIAFAGMRYGKRVIIVMPDSAPEVKFRRTASLGAEIRTYHMARDPETGERDRMTREIAEQEHAIQASPYDDPHVIAGNGVGGWEIVQELLRQNRELSAFVCPVSGGGLMAGHALAIAHGFPQAAIIGVEPSGADDFRQSLTAGRRVRIDHPQSICDGLCSYDVGEHNWPILQRYVESSYAIPDEQTKAAMRWLYQHHGLRSEPSGVISIAALLSGAISEKLSGTGDIVVVVSGRNCDESSFQRWIAEAETAATA